MTFDVEKVDVFLQHFNANKLKIREFPGCLHLELWQDQVGKNIFITYSWWENEEALNNYRDSELFKIVWANTKVLFSEKPQAYSSKKNRGSRKMSLYEIIFVFIFATRSARNGKKF
jgi:heme-degrading monooxygenase HmoA